MKQEVDRHERKVLMKSERMGRCTDVRKNREDKKKSSVTSQRPGEKIWQNERQ